MKYQPHQREKKTLSINGLLNVVRKVFAKTPNAIKVRKFSLPDCLMSALAMFSLKSPSLLAFGGKKATAVADLSGWKVFFNIHAPPAKPIFS